VAVAAREDRVLRAASEQEEGEPVEIDLDALEPGGVEGWAAYVAGAAWALGDVRGADLLVDSTVPSGAGLSSSAALACAAIGVLAERELDPVQHATLARSVEADYGGVPVGMMDQLASVLGREGHALLIDCRTNGHEALPFDPVGAGLVLLVMDTRVQHSVGDGAYADRRAACERAAERLGVPALRDASPADLGPLDGEIARRARHVVCENERVLAAAELLRTADLRRSGRC
jgi:galactokinase